MNLLDNLETSLNRKIQRRIFEQLDLIDKAEDQYLYTKHQFRLEYHEKANPIIEKRQREAVLLKGFWKDHRDSLKNLRIVYKSSVAELKENRGFNISEEKRNVLLVMAKIDSNYKKARMGFLTAVKNEEPNAVQKLSDFESSFQDFRREELEKRNLQRDQRISQINLDFQTKLSELTSNYEKQKKAIEESGRPVQFSAFKKAKQNLILEYDFQISGMKRELREKENANSENVKKAQGKYAAAKADAQAKIKSIRNEEKQAVETMSEADKQQYQELKKYIEQDFAARRLQRMDAKEALIMKNINPAYIYLAPAFFSEIFLTLLPFFFMIIGSLFRVDLANLSNSRWMGLQNFINIFTKDTEFQKALYNTVIYSFITVVLLTVATVSMAAWLAKDTKVHNIAQTMVFTPHIASLVSVSILWIAMLNPNGVINQALALFGIEGPAWLMQENTSLFSVSLVTVWKDIGYYVLIIISGLQGIPAYVYEAAKLDKASKATTFFQITLPLLAPTMSFVFITKFINSFQVFAPIEIMTNGGPMGSSMVLSYWIYKVGRVGYNYGQAMAGAIVLTIMIASVTLFKNIYSKKSIRY